MIISSEKTGYWVNLLIKELKFSGCLQVEDTEQLRTQVRRVLNECIKECAEMDHQVQSKIHSLQRRVIENSSEWGVLYSNYMHEEMVRRGFTSLTKK